VHNLAYKVAAIHQGWGSTSLLDSYQADRQHVAEINSRQSVKNGKKIFSFLKSLGATDPDATKARENLYKTIEDPSNKALIDEGVEGQREHFDNVSCSFPKFPRYVSNDLSWSSTSATFMETQASRRTPRYTLQNMLQEPDYLMFGSLCRLLHPLKFRLQWMSHM
jgi:hypothetical protein